jgi:hypothetical protein
LNELFVGRIGAREWKLEAEIMKIRSRERVNSSL